MKKKQITLLVAMLFLSQITSALTYYVRSTGGSDSNDGLTPSTAFATLTKVFSDNPLLYDGDIVDISGTFEYAINKAISKSITIQGNDRSTAIIKGATNLINKCFTVNAGVLLTIENVTFQDFFNYSTSTTKSGGVIYVNPGASLTCKKVDFKNNQSTIGGAVDINGAVVNFEDCYFYNNRAVNRTGDTAASSGAINVNFATGNSADITINRCLFEANTAEGSGAAIAYKAVAGTNAKLLIQNSTFFGNMQKTPGNGGAISLNIATIYDDIKLINNTIAYNTSENSTTNSRPGLYVAGDNGKVVLINNIISSNTDAQQPSANRSIVGVKFKETRNNMTDMTYNFVTNTNVAENSTGNLSGLTSEQLGLASTLASNGGNTQTLLLADSSLGANAGYVTGAPIVDQRNISRIGIPDIGAFESSKTTSIFTTAATTVSCLQEKGMITFTELQNFKKINIYATSGILITSNKIINNQFEFKAKAGIYLIQFEGEKGLESLKVLMN